MNGISVQLLNDMNDNLDQFNVLRKIKSKPTSSQRELASELGFSLGKLNYCLKALKEKGLVKIEFRNFPLDLAALNASKIAHCKNDGNSEILHFLDSLRNNPQSPHGPRGAALWVPLVPFGPPRSPRSP